MNPAKAATLLALMASALPAQNLLRWDGWKQIHPELMRDVGIGPERISFKPYCTTWPNCERPGIEQVVTVPSAGLYQLHLVGQGGDSGSFYARWSLGSRSEQFFFGAWQLSYTLSLPAGQLTLRITTNTSPHLFDVWSSRQPVLRPVVSPTVEARIVAPNNDVVDYLLWTGAHLLLASPRRLDSIIRVPGFGHGLELEPSGLVVVAVSANASLQLYGSFNRRLFPGDFYLQAVTLLPTAGFGSRFWIAPGF